MTDSKKLGELWNNNRENQNIYKKIEIEINLILEKFISELNKRLEEAFTNISFEFNQKKENESFKGENIIDIRMVFKALTNLASLGITIGASGVIGGFLFTLTNIWNPVGWGVAATLVIGIILSKIPNLFSSKETIIKKAKEKLYTTIEKNIEDNMSENSTKTINFINEFFNDKKDILNDFHFMINSSKKLIDTLHEIEQISAKNIDSLSSLFSMRLLQHFRIIKDGEKSHELKAKRDYPKSTLDIESPFKIDEKLKKEISELSQLKVNFKTI
ncbi:hypothetical protein EDM00_01640 [Ornithobacterium rhinotracheale]|uniref:hypothetical protein n=1 Tax=Ornithobacterium rhinotracheale TaxID=28251 RepID=UPI00129C1BA2|nr:hypothetical protein [Ornithobacterium rhinotracheale]MRI62704.1 hypothetical protein [Ornithobacterium rhinotracheale]